MQEAIDYIPSCLRTEIQMADYYLGPLQTTYILKTVIDTCLRERHCVKHA